MTGPFGYLGGKHRVAKQIVELIPPHLTYCEPLFGGGQIFFTKKPSKVEIINDLDAAVVNFFRVCQSHHEELVRFLKYCLVSRKMFALFKSQNPETLTDIQRAARFMYLQKNAFGGRILNQSYHYCVVQPPNYNPGKLPELIENTYRRLERVQIECLPYEEILKRYDRPQTFFYLDPPYWNRPLYKFNFTENDYIELEERLQNLKGKFILSLNDLPEVRKCFHRFAMREISFAYSSQPKAGKRYPELLISNFPLKPNRT
jgi:DNA adenine methylase